MSDSNQRGARRANCPAESRLPIIVNAPHIDERSVVSLLLLRDGFSESSYLFAAVFFFALRAGLLH